MFKINMQIGKSTKPRFEFRTFGHTFDKSAKLMADLSVDVPESVRERSSEEIYILSKTTELSNVKIRHDEIDIKTLVHTVDGFEQWNPLLKSGFPISTEVLNNEVFPVLNVEHPPLIKEQYSLEEFLAIVCAHPQLEKINVHKQRFGFMVNKTICEVGNVVINGVRIKTISTESTELADVKKTIADLELDDFENINYVQAIKRIIGWENKPLAN
ncbi:hypothetical protein MWU59_08915 [Flavobacteriaceae bacterium F08102]|nr:hypothetical protein [Flavobacteriaceae bacterium F08102]